MGDLKKQSLDVSPEQEAQIECLQELINAPTRNDAMLWAIYCALQFANEARKGHRIYVSDEYGHMVPLIMLGFGPSSYWKWTYLVPHPHPWKKQLFVKGRKLSAAAVWTDMLANDQTKDQAAQNWELPRAAIDEIVQYCEENKQLLQMEAAEEVRILRDKGIKLDSDAACR